MKTKMKWLLGFGLLASTLLPAPHAEARPGTLYQVSTLQALALGIYDGPTTRAQLLRHGDFGLGTLNGLDGEVVIVDGKAWQVRSDGRVLEVAANAQLPFAVVTHFRPERRLKVVAPMSYGVLQQQLDVLRPTLNVPVAFRIRGTFSHLKVRSVPRQNRPYRPLAEVVKTQSVWEWENVSGTMVGFRFPHFLREVNLADYHFHFLSDDQARGGHVLDARLISGTVEVDALRTFQMELPPGADFDRADLTVDQKEDLHKAEKG